ncbi:hypothetical protein B7463_g6276, partial [Scytalidium lignicola]
MTEAHHDPEVGAIPVPYGPGGGEEQITFPADHSERSERLVFQHILHPDDIYTDEGVYWADLPLGKRIAFCNHVDNTEAKKELGAIGSMMKKDPLSPIGWYFRNAVLPGAGLGLEGYVLFSIGNLTPLFSAGWKACWGTFKECDKNWVSAVQYLEVIGIIVGQIMVGLLGDGIGRRWGLIQDALIMFLGLVMLTASWGTTLNGWVICYAWSLFFYGIGVGGEYPMTATAAMENAVGSGKISTREDRLHRGRKVTSAFLMQGWGQFFNQVILILSLLIFNGGGNPPYSKSSIQYTYRVSFAIPAVGTLWLVYYRWYKLPLASKQLNAAKKRASVTGYDIKSLKLTIYYFGGRLLATAGSWFCNDVFFYGNKLFQSQFIKVISPNDTSVVTGWLWNLVNIFASLAGYYLASFLIDNKLYGRKNMMQVGFLMDFVLFVVPAFHYNYYSHTKGIHAFQAMYFLSSFFNQFGPNAVTFLVAAEVFPTPVRATAHGFSAAVGKLGALFASVLYNYIDTQTKFYFVPWFGLGGMLVTFLFLPDTTGLDLKEQERRWQYIREGREKEYHGIAIHPQHLSLWERMRGIGKNYDPVADYQTKIQEVRAEWEELQAAKERNPADAELLDTTEGQYTPEVEHYFRTNRRTAEKVSSGDSDSNEKVQV